MEASFVETSNESTFCGTPFGMHCFRAMSLFTTWHMYGVTAL